MSSLALYGIVEKGVGRFMSSVPQPSPGTPMPIEIPPVEAPPDQAPPPEIDEPLTEPSIPVREPGVTTPARAVTGV